MLTRSACRSSARGRLVVPQVQRRAQDWATVGVAALVRRDNGDVDDARIALTNMGRRRCGRGGGEALRPGTRIRPRSWRRNRPADRHGRERRVPRAPRPRRRPAGDRGGDAQVAARLRARSRRPARARSRAWRQVRIGAFGPRSRSAAPNSRSPSPRRSAPPSARGDPAAAVRRLTPVRSWNARSVVSSEKASFA